MADSDKEDRLPALVNGILLLVWLVAAAVAFIPFARDTSPWDAVYRFLARHYSLARRNSLEGERVNHSDPG
jgi:hypothetical protein